MRAKFSAPAALLALSLALSACGGGGGGGGTPPTPAPTATPTPGGGTAAAFTCPSSATTFAVGASSGSSITAARRKHSAFNLAGERGTLLAVSYRPDSQAAAAVEGKTRELGMTTVRELKFDRMNLATRVIATDASTRDTVAASLRSVAGVVSVAPVQRRYPLTTSAYLTSDPYFKGNNTSPLYETAKSPGQWDMHVEQMEHAFAYSQAGNGSTITNANALGNTAIKLAVIDTGEDVTHPDLKAANITRTGCFLTDTSGHQSTGSFVTDPDGHGTDVTGIAGATVGNGFGFAGNAGNVSLMLYRVFPTPDSTCSTTSSNPPAQCTAASVDIASAINDAVANGANVINMSFGGDVCSNGQDPDSTEGAAVANAIAHNVVVVAASGNGAPSTVPVGAPGCDPGVIAVGSTGYNDGQPNGTGYTGANKEYVTSYSQYGTTNVLHSASSWGIVAPGGDAASVNDLDSLHWIENIWTSTPFDTADAGDCKTDPFGGANNCRILIDGTSMASPHVAGAAALILSVNAAAYNSPSKMKALLCSTADDIGDAHQGCGRLNVYRAIATALHDPNLP